MSIGSEMQARIDMCVGPMGSGKSARILGWYFDLKGHKKNVKLVTSAEKDGGVKSRWGLLSLATIVVPGNLIKLLENKDFMEGVTYVGIDEAQFFGKDELCEFCLKLVNRDIGVYVCALDLDYKRQWWESTLALSTIADGMKKHTAPCQICYKEAPFTGKRKSVGKNELVEVGDIGELYLPLCRKCYTDLAQKGVIYDRT
jgi:thymidine kinase